METFNNDLFIISYGDDKFSFSKILNQGFLRTDRGKLYKLNNMEIAFGEIYGKPIDMSNEEISILSEFINSNSDKIETILNSTEDERDKLIEEL